MNRGGLNPLGEANVERRMLDTTMGPAPAIVESTARGELPADVVEAGRSRERSFCCGAGGGQMFLGEEKGKRVNVARVEELVATGAQVIGTACPFCQTMFRDALGTLAGTAPKLLDIAQLAAATLPAETK